MENDNLTPEPAPEPDSFEREERCRKTIKNVTRACVMRVAVVAILVWAVLSAHLEPWVWGLMAFAALITLSGLLPLGVELKKQIKLLKEILAEE